ncbi:MAG: acyl-CoA dehydrogenase, partial [Deltaproteobacteria bacterium]|nr:acyl-CoA dehydrogenase [Deltaproteobacteria bacterium]
MDNYFLDNPDLQFIFKTADLSTVVGMIENDFADRDRYAYAPESVADALDSYRRVLEIAGDVAARIIAPLGERIDNEHNLVRSGRVVYSDAVAESVQALRQAELMGCTISRKYGGLNLPNIIFIMLVEMVSQADAGIQNIFGLQGVSAIIEGFADEELKQKYLPLFAEGKATGAMALTEDEAGSDLQNVKLKAEQDADGTWRLNGVKRFITNGGAEVLLVLARSEAGTTDGL